MKSKPPEKKSVIVLSGGESPVVDDSAMRMYENFFVNSLHSGLSSASVGCSQIKGCRKMQDTRCKLGVRSVLGLETRQLISYQRPQEQHRL